MRNVFIWVILSLMVAVIARSRGRSGWLFFLLSLGFTPFVGFLAVLLVPPKQPLSYETALKKCLNCGAMVPAGARVCPSCHRQLPDVIDVEVVEKS